MSDNKNQNQQVEELDINHLMQVRREKLKELCDKENVKLIVPELRYCTDNATMIAAAAYYMYKDGRFSDLTLNIKPTDKIN